MQLTVKTQNACLAALELAKRFETGQPVCLKTIADVHAMSSPFLVQVLSQLKRAGLVRTTRGASGGYRLAKSPAEISLLDIVTAIEGPTDSPASSNDAPAAKVFFDTWSNLVEDHQRRLSQLTLESLCACMDPAVEDMYYI